MDETQIPEDAAFRIQLPTFEGPLDLLLHLIKKHELEILDLPIAFVTERYLDYLQMMQELDLDIASEYLLMAATLAHIKSKMLLPQNPLEEADEQDEAYVGDPREELIRRLLEYQKYRAAAEQLGSRPITGRDVFGRGIRTEEAQGPAPLAPIDLYKLLDAFGAILKRVKGRVALEVTAERITIHERITEISDFLRARRSCLFEELFAKDRTRYEVVVTFLALLEMTKLRMTRIYQSEPKAPIHVQYALLDADAPIPAEAELSADARAAAEPPDLAAISGDPVDAEPEPAPFEQPIAELEAAATSVEPQDAAALDAAEQSVDEPVAALDDVEQLAALSVETVPEPPLADAPELAEAPVDVSDEGTLDAQAWDELNAALEPAEPARDAHEANEANEANADVAHVANLVNETNDAGFDEDAPTLTNLAPGEPEQTTSDADSTDDNREKSV